MVWEILQKYCILQKMLALRFSSSTSPMQCNKCCVCVTSHTVCALPWQALVNIEAILPTLPKSIVTESNYQYHTRCDCCGIYPMTKTHFMQKRYVSKCVILARLPCCFLQIMGYKQELLPVQKLYISQFDASSKPWKHLACGLGRPNTWWHTSLGNMQILHGHGFLLYSRGPRLSEIPW